MSTDFLAWFSWWSYLLTATIYTAFTFYGEMPNTRAWLFSKQNTTPIPKILAVHVGFLAVLLTAMKFIASDYRLMPSWLTEIGSKGTAADILLLIAALLMHKLERRLIYVEASDNPSLGKADA